MGAVFGYQATAHADVPSTLGYQGRLKDDAGEPLTGDYDFTIRIYDAAAAGTLIWAETYTDVSVTDGFFSITLGDGGVTAGVPTYTDLAEVPFDEAYYLTSQVDADTEMTPRTPINSVAYSYRTGGVETNAADPVAGLREGRTYFNTGDNTLYVYTGGAWVAAGGGGGGAPTNATYLVTSANGSLTNEVVTSSLAANLTFAGNDAAARTITFGQTGVFDDLVVIDAGNATLNSSGDLVLDGDIAINGDDITSDGATLTINAGGNVNITDALTADSLTLDTGGLTLANSETINNSTDGAFTFGRNDAGTVTITSADNDATAALTILPGGAAALGLGGAATTAVNFTTDGTGDGEIVLPTGSISGTEILDDTVTLTTDTTGNYVANVATSVLTGLTGGSAGSEGASLTLAFDYSQALSGNVGLAANATVFGSSGLVSEGSAADNNEFFLAVTNPTADNTVTFRDASGTVILSGDTFSGDVTATLDTDGSTALTIAADSVALTTDTTGNYVASITNGSGISGGNGGSEGAALTLALGALSSNWDQTGAFDIVLNNSGSELAILDSDGTHTATIDIGNLSADATYTFSGTSGTVLTSANYTGTLNGTYLQIANNLSDLADDPTARTNIGLGTGDSPQFTGLTLTGALAANGDSITSDGATLTINAGGTVDIQDALTADSLSVDTTISFLTNGDSLNNGTDDVFDFTRDDAGTVTITASDNDATAALIVTPGGAAALTLGTNASTTAITLATDSTGDAEVVLPNESISGTEVLNDTISATDLAAALTFADGDLLNLSGINNSSSTEGLILPQAAACTSAVADGQICWDTAGDDLYIGDGTGLVQINGGGAVSLQTAYDTGNSIETSANTAVVITETTAAATTGDLLQLTLNAATGGTTSGDALQITMDAVDASGNSGAGLHIIVDQSQNTGQTVLIEDDAGADLFAVAENGNTTITGGSSGVLTIDSSVVVTTAVDITNTNFTNALSIGDNNITGTTYTLTGTTATIDFTDFDVSNDGLITLAPDSGGTGITITPSAALTTGLDVSSANITNGVSLGATTLLGTTAVIDFTDFDVSNDGLITLASDGAGDQINATAGNADYQVLVVDAATVDNTNTAGLIDLNIDAGNAAVDGINIDIEGINGITAATDITGVEILVTGSDADADFFGQTITFASTATAAAGTYEAGLFIDNADTTASSLNDGILITSSGVSGGVVDGIDVSASNITNAINVGDNTITGTGAVIDFSEFDVSGTTGTITINDGGNAGAIIIESTNLDINDLTFVGAGTIATGAGTALAIDSGTTGAINIGTGANGKTITIGNTTANTALAFNSGGTGSQTFTSNVTTGTTTTSGFVFDATAITTGTGAYLISDSVTTGKLLDITTAANITWTGDSAGGGGLDRGLVNITSSSTAGATSGESALLYLTRSGANSNTGHTAYGIYSTVTNTNGTSGTNIAAWFSASGATTGNYGLVVESGRVGIGDTTPDATLEISGPVASGAGNADDFLLAVGGTGGACTTTNNTACGTGGLMAITGGVGGTNTANATAGGQIALSGVGGSLTLTGGAGGNSTGTGSGGGIVWSGNGGSLNFFGGAAGSAGSGSARVGSGGSVNIAGGASTSTTFKAGSVYIYGGDNSTDANDGNVYLGLDSAGTSTGNVLIGTSSGVPAASGKLTIGQADAADDEVLYLQTDETTGSQKIFTANTGAGGEVFYITANGETTIGLDGDASTTAAICGNQGAGDVADTAAVLLSDCSSTPAADYMEMYPVAQNVEAGDLLSVGTTGVTTHDGDTIQQLIKSDSPYDTKVIGIASNPEKAGDFNSIGYNIDSSDNPWPVALNGRVPVKIATISDDIQPGDLLTTSIEPGRAMKATQPGQVIGKALQAWSSANPTDTVMVFVTTSYADLNSSNAIYKTNIGGLTFGLADLMRLRPVEFDWKNTGERDLGFIAEEVEQVNPLLAAYQNGELSGVRYKLLSVLAVQAIQEQQLQIDNILSSIGVSPTDWGATPNVSVAPVSQFTGNIRVAGTGNFGQDSVGQAKILAGDTTVKVTFTAPYEYQPIVTITPTGEEFLDVNVKYAVTNQTLDGFYIELDDEYLEDLTFNWHAFGAYEGKIFISDDTVEDINITVIGEDQSGDEAEINIEDNSGNGGDQTVVVDDGSTDPETPAEDTSTADSDEQSGTTDADTSDAPTADDAGSSGDSGSQDAGGDSSNSNTGSGGDAPPSDDGSGDSSQDPPLG